MIGVIVGCMGCSAVCMFIMTKWAIRASKKLAFYDRPKERSFHKAPTPLLGGAALFFSLACTILPIISWQWSPFNAGLIGAIFIFLIGLYDDKYALNPWIKMILQSVVITALFFNGIRINFVTWPGEIAPLFFGPLASFLVTQLWMITIINMFNIIDGIDGLAGGISCLTSLVLLWVSLAVSPSAVSVLLCAMVGATGMFLRFNFHPAKIFLGDSGALLLGYCFALVSILGVLKSTISVMILVFIFAVPLMDLCLSIIRRTVKRKNIFYPDLEHIHHQLVTRGLSVPKSAGILYGISGVFGVVAIVASKQSRLVDTIIGLTLFLCTLAFFSVLQLSKKQVEKIKK